MRWESLDGLYGHASHGNIVTLNLNYISADNRQADFSNIHVRGIIAHTIAHEVSHCVNGDQVDDTYDYFLEEYRAFYVGFMAEYGRAPTRAEMAERVLIFVQEDEYYKILFKALQSEEQGDMILEFVNQFLGRTDVARENVVECVLEAIRDSSDKTTAILPAQEHDMDN
jgi:hypothetical protein